MPTREECNTNGYKNAHALVRRHLLKIYPEKCMHCGSTNNIEAANVSDDPCSRDRKDYLLLCKRCHVKMDGHEHNLVQGKTKNDIARSERLLGMKTCPRCKETKPLDAYRDDPSRVSGHWPYCRDCEKVINREKKRKMRAKL